MTFTKNFEKPAKVQILMNTMVILMQKIWINLSGKTHCKAITRLIATRHATATHWPQGSRKEAGTRSRNTERQDANRQKNYYSHTMLINDCAQHLRFNGIELSQKPLFKRFNRVLINTIYTNFENNSKQLFERLLMHGSTNKAACQWKNLGLKSANLASQFHKEAYDSWGRNLHLLNPEKMFITSVNDTDELLINNKSFAKTGKSASNLKFCNMQRYNQKL